MTAFDLHQYTSLLGLGFGLFHALILLANHYVQYNIAQVLVPFVDAPYRPLWTGLGQVSLYVLALVTFTFYVRRQIGKRAWYLIHLLSYVTFVMVIVHGLLSGTDSGNVLVLWLYWLSLVSLAGLTVYRVGIERQQAEARQG
jgi:predicted ferric reductase